MKCFLVSLLLLLFDSVDSFSFSRGRTPSNTNLATQTATALFALEVDATSEVVGGHGDVGSLFLREESAIAVPRGVAPGCLSSSNSNGSPIVVTVPPKNWKDVYESTLIHRRQDLVWIVTANGSQRLSPWQRNGTVAVMPPPGRREAAYVYGKHTAALQTTLNNHGINVVFEVESWTDMCDLVAQASGADKEDPRDSHASDSHTRIGPNHVTITIPTIDLVCTGEPIQNSANIQSAIVVGGGILGSSIARALSQRLNQVTLYDPTSTGIATPASWAWLNANQKPPPAYKSLNQMGLRAWRSDPLLSSLESLKWSGTLVQTKEPLDIEGGYTAEGPLSTERIRELEPEANFTDGGYVYYFADEGHVDPQEAVQALRQEAMKKGAAVVSEERVVGLVRSNGRVVGVKTPSSREHLADVVVVAAGANSSILGGVPLVHNPSKTYFGDESSNTSSPLLHRTLVDMTSSLYLAQRPDGTVVAGGGAIKFGLSRTSKELSSIEVQQQLTMAQEVAQQLAPNPVGSSPLTHKTEVISKPMPKDGFPIVGFVEPGLYSAVTHSGMTLSPLIAQLVAAEVQEKVSLSILDDYRPTRFDKQMEKDFVQDWQEFESKEKLQPLTSYENCMKVRLGGRF